MRRVLVGIAITGAVVLAPMSASAQAPPNGRNCIGVVISQQAPTGSLGPAISSIATSSPGAYAATLAVLREAACNGAGLGR